MKKIIAIFIFPLTLIAIGAHAEIGLNENIYSGCIVDLNGIMYGCLTRQESIANITSFANRPDIKLHDVINYSYTCEDNFLTDIEIVSNDGSEVGKFQYNGEKIENDANGLLRIKDFNSDITGRAKYNKNCQLSITSIHQDLSIGSILLLTKDVCTMDFLNNIANQTENILNISSEILNNLTQLNAEMTSLMIDLENLKGQVTDPQEKIMIDNIVGKDGTEEGSISYIMTNSSSWGQNSQILLDNLNLLYSNIQSTFTSLNSQTAQALKNIYNSDIEILNHSELQSTQSLLNSFIYENLRSQGQDTSIYTAPICK